MIHALTYTAANILSGYHRAMQGAIDPSIIIALATKAKPNQDPQQSKEPLLEQTPPSEKPDGLPSSNTRGSE